MEWAVVGREDGTQGFMLAWGGGAAIDCLGGADGDSGGSGGSGGNGGGGGGGLELSDSSEALGSS